MKPNALPISILGLVACALLALIAIGAQTQVSDSSAYGPQAMDSEQSSEFGLPAIKPTLQKATGPQFTADDVKNFLKASPTFAGATVNNVAPTILEITFMSSAQASKRIVSEIGLPDTADVCFVELRGPFSRESDSRPPGATLPVADLTVLIFDARTGNLLVKWVPDPNGIQP